MNRIQRLSAAAASFAITAAILSSVAGYALPDAEAGASRAVACRFRHSRGRCQ